MKLTVFLIVFNYNVLLLLSNVNADRENRTLHTLSNHIYTHSKLHYTYIVIVWLLLCVGALSCTMTSFKFVFVGDFLNVRTHCTPKMAQVKLNIHSSCPRMEATTRKCHGYCRSFTGMMLNPPYLSKNCTCCKPTTIEYKSLVISCQDGINRTMLVPNHVECSCRMCASLPVLETSRAA